ncbi:MAG: hypothetical protein IKC56_04550, partial [Clostridia bacterium]|nr:hypothetical protein [Clostridia bacterium]
LSTGDARQKADMLSAARLLRQKGYSLYATARAFGAKVVTCPYCEYTLYYAEAEDEVEDKSDIHRAISLGRPPVENKRYLNRAISLGRLPKDKYDHIMKWDPEFKKERFDSPSDFIKKY